jgi:hypothetical protein
MAVKPAFETSSNAIFTSTFPLFKKHFLTIIWCGCSARNTQFLIRAIHLQYRCS